ncbi:methyl-accepting chemotaxis protein [Nitrincola sp. A-D6]|uniref:methyl-accepting chemotaxis protein n=1 Tax=Nitrincola sp. A-D6 TaxID=1545442 RepID=UPI000B1368BA|nr:PAS domain-containing methyl-accepting chemotaxis protein [Nitrincola sp. A-D6]
MKKNLPVTQQEAGFPDTANILTTTDLKGAITYANEDFVKISGFTREELIGNNHNMVRHPDMPPAAFAQLWTRVKSGNSWMGLVKNRCKNGDHYWVDAYVTPILQAGKVAEYQSIRRRADRKSVARAEKLYAALSAGKKPKQLSGSLSFNVRLQCWFLLPFLALLAGLLWLESSALMAGVVVLALVVAMLGQWLTLSPLRHAVAKARRVINDPVGQYVYTGRKDEVGEILLAFKALEAETAGLVGRISDSAGSMMQGATSMNAAVGSSSDGIQRQFSETDQVAAAINEMSASVQEVAHNAQQTSTMAYAGLESVAAGKKVVSETQSLIQSLRQEIAEGAK